jgi:hypothetical protein
VGANAALAANAAANGALPVAAKKVEATLEIIPTTRATLPS